MTKQNTFQEHLFIPYSESNANALIDFCSHYQSIAWFSREIPSYDKETIKDLMLNLSGLMGELTHLTYTICRNKIRIQRASALRNTEGTLLQFISELIVQLAELNGKQNKNTN